METSKNFALKDYLLYFFPGMFWLMNVLLLFLPLNNQAAITGALSSIKTTLDSISPLLLTVLLLTIPYSTGFLLETVNSAFTHGLRKVIFDPKNEVVKKNSRLPEDRRVNPDHLPLLVDKIKSTFSQSSGQEKERVFGFFGV